MARRRDEPNQSPAYQTPANPPPAFTPPVKRGSTQDTNPTIQVDTPLQPSPSIPSRGIQRFPFGKGQSLANIQSDSALTDLGEQEQRQEEGRVRAKNTQIAGDVGQFTPEQQAAIAAGSQGQPTNPLANIAAGAPIAGAAGALAAGAVTIGTGGLAIGGAVLGGLVKIGAEKRQDVKQAISLYTTAKSNLNYIQNQVNQGLIDPQTATDAWNEELMNIRIAEANLKRLTQGNVNKFLANAQDDLNKVEGFQRTIGQRNRVFQNALINPDPNAIIPPTPEVVDST